MTTTQRSSALRKAIGMQLHGLGAGFCESTLPWENPRSAVAGLSGLLYALPACFARSHLERVLWPAQAACSVLADYVYIGHAHAVQGIDRAFASMMVMRIVFIGTNDVSPWALLLAIPPLGCFVCANTAKRRCDFGMWVRYHSLWHIIGAALCTLVTALAGAGR
jgi:hypothetical protein